MSRTPTWGLAVLLTLGLAGPLPAGGGTLVTAPLQSISDLGRLTFALCDSALCDTGACLDAQGVAHRVYADSGRILYQSREPELVAAGDDWSVPMRLNRSRTGSDPLVVEVRLPGSDAILFAVWRESVAEHFEVFRSYRIPALYPPCWTRPLNVTPR